MKAVIIGGGIGGLCAGVFLKKDDWEVTICERENEVISRGHAFLINYEGLNVFKEIQSEINKPLKKQHLNLFHLLNSDNHDRIKIQLLDWYCMKRVDLIDFLIHCNHQNQIKFGRKFDHFIYENNKAIAAVFQNGDVEYGDVFIGADGSNSKVRESIFGPTNFVNSEVYEIVGSSKYSGINNPDRITFKKFQSEERPVAFGLIPNSADEVVWFLQFDNSLLNLPDKVDTKVLKNICNELIINFPDEVRAVLKNAQFENSYLWRTKDFDLLNSFHKNNVVLIGDAAHLSLPFTSAGTTNAITDAVELVNCLKKNDLNNAFQKYYDSRKDIIESHIIQGRVIKDSFLNPNTISEKTFKLPLVRIDKQIDKANKASLKLLYFTDPICSTCWIIQPMLRKMYLDFGNQIEVEYKMGGLLPSWNEYQGNSIKSPEDAAILWDELKDNEKMIISGDVWINDPLHSSYPPSIAFKAAQIQSGDKSLSFLRRIKEMLFVENKNITKWMHIESAALACGLDTIQLLNDYNSIGMSLFNDDLKMTKEMNVNSFPTFFTIENGAVVNKIVGVKKFDEFLEELYKSDRFQILSHKKDPITIFKKFNNMTTSEFSYLMDLNITESESILNVLFSENIIEKETIKNSIMWKYKLNKHLPN